MYADRIGSSKMGARLSMVFCAFPVMCAPAVFIGEWVHFDCIQKGDTDLGMAYSLGAFGGRLH